MTLLPISISLYCKHPAKKYKMFTDKQLDQNDVIPRHKHFIIRFYFERRDVPRFTTITPRVLSKQRQKVYM